MATQYGANHPQYQRQRSENESLHQKINAEARKILAGIRNSAQQSRQREADLASALATQRSRLLDLKDNRNEFMVLKRNVDSAEKAYDTALARQVVSRVESRASQTNVTVLTPAVRPARPVLPRIKLNIALSVLVGIMFGVAIVLLIELTDRRVRSITDLQLDVPLLAVLRTWEPGSRRLLGLPGGSKRALPSAV
jgi:uncharacterized protein involved in exopolysaccharide biosynthesis